MGGRQVNPYLPTGSSESREEGEGKKKKKK